MGRRRMNQAIEEEKKEVESNIENSTCKCDWYL